MPGFLQNENVFKCLEFENEMNEFENKNSTLKVLEFIDKCFQVPEFVLFSFLDIFQIHLSCSYNIV